MRVRAGKPLIGLKPSVQHLTIEQITDRMNSGWLIKLLGYSSLDAPRDTVLIELSGGTVGIRAASCKKFEVAALKTVESVAPQEEMPKDDPPISAPMVILICLATVAYILVTAPIWILKGGLLAMGCVSTRTGTGFSVNRTLGISAAKARISRRIGIPLSRSGRQQKIGRIVQKLFFP
jgi:hypothetical protein